MLDTQIFYTEHLILGVPQPYEVDIISSTEINSVTHRKMQSNFPKNTESYDSNPHMCNSQIHACLISLCCSQTHMY